MLLLPGNVCSESTPINVAIAQSLNRTPAADFRAALLYNQHHFDAFQEVCGAAQQLHH